MMKAIVAGISATLILQVTAAKLNALAYECCIGDLSAPPLWLLALSSPLGALISLLPGFVAGWFAPRKAILVGFLAGLLGNAIYSTIFLTDWESVTESGPLTCVEMVLRLLILATSWGLGAAAAAGTAQLLRSSKSAQPSRMDVRN
jgi:hypothetical protein